MGENSPSGLEKNYAPSIFLLTYKAGVIGSVPQRMKMHQKLAFPWKKSKFLLGVDTRPPLLEGTPSPHIHDVLSASPKMVGEE